jgi:alkaline phosphatase
MVKRILPILLLSLPFLSTCQEAPPPRLSDSFRKNPTPDTVKNIILLIGDGMGLAQISAGIYTSEEPLNIQRFKVIGLHNPISTSHLVTDSAAGATAFACGIKTYNKAIGVGPDSMACKTIFEEAKERNFATGLITTSTIVHATPAAFISHIPNRMDYEDIAEAFPESGLDFFVGGGARYFRNRKKDDRDILEEMELNGYQIHTYFSDELVDITPNTTQPFGFITSYDDPLTVENGRDYLLPASKKGMDFLASRSDQGFLLVIEGAQIDWGGHANNGDYIVREMLDFDLAIGAALDFATNTPGTLVIVTADHEAGGFAINPESSLSSLKYGFTTIGHTGTLIPVFAYGPGAENFMGFYENTAIYQKLMTLLGWQENQPVKIFR